MNRIPSSPNDPVNTDILMVAEDRVKGFRRLPFHAIAERKAPLSLFYSETDPGLDHFASYFGADGKRLAEYGIATFKTVANADHNLTPACARDAFRDEVQTLALRL